MTGSERTAGIRGVAVCVLLALAAACSTTGSATGGRVRVVAAFYPLAWAAEQIGGADVAVEDLTPAGGEPHDLQLTARQRVDVQNAALVLLLGKGFQPEVEKAAKDSRGKVVDLLAGLALRPSNEKGLEADPHVWLDPALMRRIAAGIADALSATDAAHRAGYAQRASALDDKLAMLDEQFRPGLRSCALSTLVTTHEAFGYLAAEYGLTQIGLTGLTPESEPTAAQIQRVREEARRGRVAAVFYEATDEGRRIGQSVARDVKVKALPLNTLESDPAPQDYPSQMRANLDALTQGLRCSR